MYSITYNYVHLIICLGVIINIGNVEGLDHALSWTMERQFSDDSWQVL